MASCLFISCIIVVLLLNTACSTATRAKHYDNPLSLVNALYAKISAGKLFKKLLMENTNSGKLSQSAIKTINLSNAKTFNVQTSK